MLIEKRKETVNNLHVYKIFPSPLQLYAVKQIFFEIDFESTVNFKLDFQTLRH